MSGGERLRLRPERLEWRLVDGEIVGLDLERCEYVRINASGTALWPMLVTGATRDELEQGLVAEFRLDEGAAARDVEAFLTELGTLAWLERVPPGG